MTAAAKIFTEAWQSAQKASEPARFAIGVRTLPYAELLAAIANEDTKFIFEFVRSFHSGEIYIFTNAFDPADLAKLKNDAFAWGKAQKSQEAQILEKIPDYWSRRDWHAEDHGPGYSSTFDMYHFFRWNDDPIGVFKLFDPKYGVLRIISGYSPDDIRDNGPDDGIVDRAELSHYPPGVGGIAFHSDPIAASRFFFTVNLNRFGVDYHAGGFAVGTGDGKTLAIDPMLEVGSLTGFLPSVCHGVEIIDPNLPPTRDGMAGRWYGAISMVNSHKVKNRQYTRPVEGYPTLREQIKIAKVKSDAVA
jgi:hypothetical protein